MDTIKRDIVDKIKQLMKIYPAVVLIGARQVGKTTILKQALPSAKFFDSWFDNYFKTYIERDVRSLFPTLRLDSFKKFIKMLAQSSGDIINYSDFARSLDVSQPNIKKYMEIADGTFIWRTLNSYTKNSKKNVIKMPKGHFRDSGLLCFLLNIHSVEQLQTHHSFGRIWESFVIEQLLATLLLTFNLLNLILVHYKLTI